MNQKYVLSRLRLSEASHRTKVDAGSMSYVSSLFGFNFDVRQCIIEYVCQFCLCFLAILYISKRLLLGVLFGCFLLLCTSHS